MGANWNVPGPVSMSYLQDRSMLSAIMGPVGSAKTSTTVMKLLNISAEQRKSIVDGVRRTKWAVVRDTYRNLNRTTIPSFKTWLPSGGSAKWTGGGSEPAKLEFKARLTNDNSVMEMLVEFFALGDQSIEDVARGWEGTGFWQNEGDLQSADVMPYLFGRVGRYPSALHGGCTWSGGVVDYNAPDTENYLYKFFEEDGIKIIAENMKEFTAKLYKQPGGRDPRAENLHNLPVGYYDRQVAMYLGMGRDDLVRRMVDNLYGFTRDGKPVYPEYRDDYHCSADEIMPIVELPIKIDVDQGLHPALLLRQEMPSGQTVILDEIRCEGGAVELAERFHRLKGSGKYEGCRFIGGKADPAAKARSGNDAESWLDTINRLLGLIGITRITVAKTNDPDKRQSAVRIKLRRNTSNGKPGLVISRSCKMLRKGFNSEYKFKRSRVSSGGSGFADKPEKNEYADVHDALQYGSLDDGGYEEVIGRERRVSARANYKTHHAKLEVRI